MRLLIVYFALLVFVASAGAEVFWFEAEEFDEEKSNPIFVGQVNASWDIKEDTKQEIRDDKVSFNNKYVISVGGNRDVVAGAAGLAYILPEVENPVGWKLWTRCIMGDTGSDSFFLQISKNGGETWRPPEPMECHGAEVFQEWRWHRPWDVTLVKGEGNGIRISERESNAKLDVICLRNDNQTPTDEEYQAYLDEIEKQKIAVDARGKLAGTWGKIKAGANSDR